MNLRKDNSGFTFVRRIFGFSMASWVNCLISLISTPITTAVFAPEQLGKINLFISYANILIPFIYLGFDQAYVRFYNEPCGKNTANSLFRVCVGISLIAAVPVAAVVLIGWKYFSGGIMGYEAFSVALCLFLYLVATMLLRYTNLRARMENNTWMFFVQSVISTVIIKLSFVAVALVKPDPQYAIAARTGLLVLASLIFLALAFSKGKKEKCDHSAPVLKELSRFALPVFPTAFLVMLNLSLSQLMLNRYVDYSMIGIYSNAVTIAGIITIIQSGLNTFWTPFVYEYHTQPKRVQKMHHVIAFLMLCMAFGIVMMQDVVYWILVDVQYWESKTIMAFLLISPVCETISETLGLGIELSKKTYLKLPVYTINILVNVSACLLLIPRFGILGAAMANALASLSMLIAKAAIGEHFYRCSDRYSPLVIGILLVIANGFVSYFAGDGIVKVISSLLGILMTCLLYRDTVSTLLKGAISMVRSVKK